jgi:parallel beta-helix repeat protein
MKARIRKGILIFVIGVTCTGGLQNTLFAFDPGCFSTYSAYSAYGIYYHNPGTQPRCLPDYDLDLPEFGAFKQEFGVYPNAGFSLIADYFGDCGEGEIAHGTRVRGYFLLVKGGGERLNHYDYDDDDDWDQVFQYIAENYSRGTVVNVSANPGNWSVIQNAVLSVIDQEVIVVGASGTFAEAPVAIKDRVLLCKHMDAQGVLAFPWTLPDANIAMICAPTNWDTGLLNVGFRIAAARLNQGYRDSWTEYGSYSTPMVTGVVQHVANIVAARDDVPEDEFIQRVLDYVVSSCDRHNDPGSYERRTGTLQSYAPWSHDWGYGVFSAWKAMIYAYGYGRLEAKDEELDPGLVTNPPTIFSDHFYLRGDLLIPVSQTFRVDALATVSVDPAVTSGQEGPEMGDIPSHPEIHVEGEMEVYTSLLNEKENPADRKKGVNATITIDNGGMCTVFSGGTVTIGTDQHLDIAAGGLMELKGGGELIVDEAGTVVLNGDFVVDEGATLVLNGDLVIEEGATLTIQPGATVLVASTDSNHDPEDGIDPNRVEIIVKGSLVCGTEGSSPIVFQSNDPAPAFNDWYGIRYLPSAGPSNLDGVIIKNAYIAVRSDVAVTVDECGVQDCILGVWSIGGATVTNSTFSDLQSFAIQIGAGSAILDGVTVANSNGINFSTPGGEVATLVFHNSSVDGGGVVVGTAGNGLNTFDLKNVGVTNNNFSAAGIMISTGSSGSIDSCTVSGNDSGIILSVTSGIVISDCLVNDNSGYGIYEFFGNGHTIIGNTITGSAHGMYFKGTQNVKVEGNDISGNTVGVSTLDESNVDLGGGNAESSGNNSITDNSLYQVGNLNMATTIMAENNWWGSDAGPHPTKIQGSVDYDPWLEESPLGSQPAVSQLGNEFESGDNGRRGHKLLGVYPNPLNPVTTISYEIAEPGSNVEIKIFDSNGRLVRSLVSGYVTAGSQSVVWDGTNDRGHSTASGVYFVRLVAQDYRVTRKLVLLK